MYDEMDLVTRAESVNTLLARYGVKFGIYKNSTFKEQLFPFDAIPRMISADEFDRLDRGLRQRVKALNLFLEDIYNEKRIVRDKVVPEEFIYASSGYLAQCEGAKPPKGVWSHISGIDLVQAKDGGWFILEDNLRVPSGASYPMIARELCRRASPTTFQENHLEDNRNYARLLRQTMDHVNTGGLTVILTPGRYVGIEEKEEDDEPFVDKMNRLTTELGGMFAKSHELEEEIKKNLAGIGFKI